MRQALRMLDEIRSVLPKVDVRPSEEGWGDLANVLDVHAMLGTAEATLRGALAREETRGAHIRSDFPDLHPTLQLNFVARHEPHAGMSIEPAPIPPVSVELEPWMTRAGDGDSTGKLLE
jgi:succinate dehydrogenase / fumarate reductase flavoprotein subunit